MENRFLALVSHELRTPISAILGYTHLLQEGIPEPVGARAGEQVRRIAACAAYLTEVIDQVLEYARLEAGDDTAQIAEVHLEDVFGDVRAWAEPLAAEKKLTIRILGRGAPDRFQTDGRHVRQILLNLLGNAIKFTRDGEITLTARANGGRILFHVTDQGCGIEPRELERIFEPFVRGERTAADGQRGAGLGLAISRMLAHGLGGDLRADNAEAGGSVFTLWLPLQRGVGAEA